IILAQLVGVVGVVDGQHRDTMPHFLEAGDGLSADALRGTVGRDEVGVGGFELLEFVEKAVELAVGNLRPGLDIVEVVMTVDLAAQVFDPLFGSAHGTPWEMPGDSDSNSLSAFSLPPHHFASVVDVGYPATCSPAPGQSSQRPRPAATCRHSDGERRATPMA